MNRTTFSKSLVALFTSLALFACGGGGSGGSGIGTGSDVVSIGAVESLGSIWVNGVRYHTGSSSVTFDDSPGSESDIKAGQSVVVNGSVNSDGISGTATSVAVVSEVKGPVTANNYNADKTLTVLGQTVQITDLTNIDNSIPNIATVSGDVEVHGHVRGDGLIEATYIEAKALIEYKVIGFARNIGPTTFTIGALTIDTATAPALIEGLSDGALVEAKGNPPLNGSGQLVATKVEGVATSSQNIAKIEIEGFVTVFNSSASFTVGNIPVTTSGSTRFVGGLPDEILLGSKLEVEGSLSGGVLAATKVSFRYNVKIEGDIASYNGSVMTITGLAGITINVDSLTEIDGTPAAGEQVRLRGFKTGNGVMTATRLEDRGSPGDRLILEGPVESFVANTSMTIMGVLVNTTTIPNNEFYDENDNVIGEAVFYSSIRENSIVKVRDDAPYGAWEQTEIEYR